MMDASTPKVAARNLNDKSSRSFATTQTNPLALGGSMVFNSGS
jgi:hypothetical protein